MVEVYLPDECWEHVFTFLNNDKDNRRCLKSVSVVSKRFLSITNRLRYSLTICKDSRPFLTAIFQRFPNITSLKFSPSFSCRDCNTILSEISSFPMNITSLNLKNQQFIPVYGLQDFSQNVKSATSLNCSCMDFISVTDLSFIADCFPLLEELNLNNIEIFHGNMLNGIETISLALSKLRKVSLSGHTYMNDNSLFQLFNNCKLLEEVIIFGCSGIMTAGIASALCVTPTLRSLSLTNYVYNCTTLLAIVRSCPSLSDIKMENYTMFNWKKSMDSSYTLMNFVVSPRLKSLCLAYNTWLNDESIIAFASSFPNMQKLDLSHCNQISEGICQLLRRCSKIRELNLSYCSKVKLHGLNFEIPKLEVLNLSYTRTNDKELYLILKNCTQLREINLTRCNKVDKNIVASMRSSRPSLKIVGPFQRQRE